MLDRLEAESLECHSLMVIHHGHVVAEGWWEPYAADRPHLLYSLTKSFVSVATGIAIDDGLLSLEDRVVDLLPDHVPTDASERVHRLTVHHLLSMTAGHAADSLDEAWQLEPDDLAKGFLRVPFPKPEGTWHAYDNPTTYTLARIVERVTGRDLPGFLEERLFAPMGIEHAEWDRVSSGAVFGFTGLHLTTEAVAAFGELLLREGRWGDQQLVSAEWIRLATSWHVATQQIEGWSESPDALCGYGYQFWISRHGYRADGAFGQYCLVVPAHDLVVVLTSSVVDGGALISAVWDCLLPDVDREGSDEDDARLAERLRGLALTPVAGSAEPGRIAAATLDASDENSALAHGSPVHVEPTAHGWTVRLGSGLDVEVGNGEWRESSPLGRPAVASGGWQGDRFVAEIRVITTPHTVKLALDADSGTATATWVTPPLTNQSLEVQLRSPLMTRPDVA